MEDRGDTTAERLVAIETALMQLQYDIEQLNSAVLAQQAELQELRRGLSHVAALIEMADQPPPADERPPHY